MQMEYHFEVVLASENLAMKKSEPYDLQTQRNPQFFPVIAFVSASTLQFIAAFVFFVKQILKFLFTNYKNKYSPQCYYLAIDIHFANLVFIFAVRSSEKVLKSKVEINSLNILAAIRTMLICPRYTS